MTWYKILYSTRHWLPRLILVTPGCSPSVNFNQAMSGKKSDGGVLDDDDEDQRSDGDDDDDGGCDGGGGGRQESSKDDKEYFQVPSNLSGARHFKGITKNKKTCEVEVTVRLPSR